MSNKKNDYEVGYRKPPKRSQFAKGQSGNRKGRPKGTKNRKTDLAEELSELIHIKVSGRKVKVSKQRAMLKGLLVKAMKGDPTAAKVMLGLIERLLNLDDESQGQNIGMSNRPSRVLNDPVERSPKGVVETGSLVGIRGGFLK